MDKKPKVLAIASGGGHWVQLLRLRPAFEECDVLFATTREGYRSEVAPQRFKLIPDGNRWQKLKLLKCALAVAILIIREKPDIIATTGAAPGYFAIRFGNLLRKKTIWVDSIANAGELSMSGQQAGKYTDLWITQWEHLAKPEGPSYLGNVLG